MRTRGSLQFAILTTMGLGACAGGDIDWAGTVTDSAGVTIIQSPEQGIWTANQSWGLEEELRVGTAQGDPDYMFGAITGITVGSDDRIFVLDQQASNIRVFDRNGTLERQFGTSGSGPGQFGPQVGPLLLGPGDTLYVPDLGNQRVNRYTTDGTMAGSFAIRLERGVPFKWEVTPSGTIVNQVRRIAFQPGQANDTLDVVAARNNEGMPTDTLLLMPSGRTLNFGGNRPEVTFFSPEPAWTLAGERSVWYGISDSYRIGLYEEGELTRVITKAFELAPLTERDQEVVMNAMRSLVEAAGAPPEAWQLLQQTVHFADRFPAYAQFLTGPNGSLWVQHLVIPSQLSDEELEDFNPQTGLGSSKWDVFDGRGRYLGSLDMPERYQPVRFLGDRIYGIWRDDLDVQYVMQLRITGLPGADTGVVPITD
jgi:hypothetical protein